MAVTRVGVLISGGGTNLQALIDATTTGDVPATIAVVISNRAKAGGLDRARSAGIPAVHIGHRQFPSRAAYDEALVQCLRAHQVEWVCLAGFMRLITDTFLSAFPGRVLNIHPALLPAFPGLHGQEQALHAGVQIAGATVHFVDRGCDTGPIIAQGAVPVLPDDHIDSLKQRILTVEHQLYPQVLRWAAEGRLHLNDGKVRVTLAPGEQRFVFNAS
jgi:phosphoribosylglycinamide formyltransferase 1